MCKSYLGFAILGFCLAMIVGWAAPVQADCPNIVLCKIFSGNDVSRPEGLEKKITIGTISVPTCYKFLLGCAPWHCENSADKDKDSSYWKYQCMQNFPERCTASNGCFADFPLIY